MSSIIYKIVPALLWQEAKRSGRFDGTPVDLADGYVHFSTGEQVLETAARYFEGQEGLLLVAVDGDALGEELVYEPSRGGALFPHLYAPPLPVGRSLGKAPAARRRRRAYLPGT